MQEDMVKDNNRKNINRGYQKLRVWNTAIEYYVETCRVFKSLSFELKKIYSQQISAVDSIHRNIAEGYSRRSIREYINFLYIALASLSESVSSLAAYKQSKQIIPEDFEKLDSIAFQLENGLLRLVQALEIKREKNEWSDSLFSEPSLQYSISPTLPSSSTSPLHYSNTPLLQD